MVVFSLAVSEMSKKGFYKIHTSPWMGFNQSGKGPVHQGHCMGMDVRCIHPFRSSSLKLGTGFCRYFFVAKYLIKYPIKYY